MEVLKDNKMLKYHPDTIQAVREEHGLNKPGRMEEALGILKEWIKKQPHFVKKDFSREYLERTFIMNKGLVERSKSKLDKLCTLKTLMPEFYILSGSEKELDGLDKVMLTAHLPQLTPEQSRVHVIRMASDSFDSSIMWKFYKYLILIFEYMSSHDYCSNYTAIIDCRQVRNALNLVTKVNPLDLRPIITLMTEGYGARIKAIHLISESKAVEAVLGLLKQVFSSKVASKIQVHKTLNSVYECVPRDILPADYGGKERTLKEIHDDWIEELTSEEFLEYFREMAQARTNESFRQADQFSYMYANMPGSFRALSVD